MSTENTGSTFNQDFDSAYAESGMAAATAEAAPTLESDAPSETTAPETTDEAPTPEVTELPEADSKVDYVTVTDENGKRQRVKVDYTPEKVQNAYKMAAGMRKSFAERDTLKRENETLKAATASAAEEKQLYGKLEEAYATKGVDGLIRLLSKGQESLDSYVEKHSQRQHLKNKDPQAYDALLAQEARDAQTQARDAEFSQMKEKLSRIEQERDAVELKAFESEVNPVFFKYSFTGKLGDEGAEHRFNRSLWVDSMEELNGYELKGHTVTPAMVNKVFSKNATEISKYLTKTVEKKTSAALDQKRKLGKESAQAQVLNKTSSATNDKMIDDHIAQGNIAGLFDKFFR